MTDIKSKEERSRNMSAIKSKNTKPEVYFRKLLFSKGYRYSLHSKNIPGHPDLWLKKYNTAVFIHGCFWHRHDGCKYAYSPKSKHEFWDDKFLRNKNRDEEVLRQLSDRKIRCLVIWECTIKNMNKRNGNERDILNIVENFLKSDNDYLEI